MDESHAFGAGHTLLFLAGILPPSPKHTQGVSYGWQSPHYFVTQRGTGVSWHRLYIAFISKHTCCWHTAGSFRCLIVLFAILLCLILLCNCKSLCAGQVLCEQKLCRSAQCPGCALLFVCFNSSWLSHHRCFLSAKKNPLVCLSGEGPCCCLQVTTCTWG